MTIKAKVSDLVALINLERPHQGNAVQWALMRLLDAGQKGVVLADEVGCGKTYEALALMALLWYHYQGTAQPVRRVLILCKSSLLRKWHDEITANEIQRDGTKHGLRPYLTGNDRWVPFTQQFIDQVHMINKLDFAKRLWNGQTGKQLRGMREDQKLQVPPGLYLVNHQLLYESKRDAVPLLKRLYRTNWDLVIVDEAHHYGKGNKCDSIFAKTYRGLGRGVPPDFGIAGTLIYRHILLLTATPFELTPHEMLNLLRIADASKSDLETLRILLEKFQQALGTFYGLRTLPPTNERRQAIVKSLHQFRVGEPAQDGLETILRRYLVRNLKNTAQREYTLVNWDQSGWQKCCFDKFDDLKALTSQLPLIPFTGPDALFYLELRTLVQEMIEQRNTDQDSQNTFVAMDLQQGLSSYRQLLSSALLKHKAERAQYLRALLEAWDSSGRLHPKVGALVEVVTEIFRYEIERLKRNPRAWFAKVVIFNKLVSGTAPHLRRQLETALEPMIEGFLQQLVQTSPFGDVETLHKAVQHLVYEEVGQARTQFTQKYGNLVEDAELIFLLEEVGFEPQQGVHIVDKLIPDFNRRVLQPLFLIDFLRSQPGPCDEGSLQHFIRQNLIEPALKLLDETIDKYLDAEPDPDEVRRLGGFGLYETGITHLLRLRENLHSPKIVARYDGKEQEFRESNRINFNERWNPLVLIVSRVGEEGIDLQRQARYILHYDLEWNPAKMEQREGRIDREGYGHQGEAIDVRFFLLKGTYEERIFHTVMQRDQWFQILMGQKRKSLGQISSDEDGVEALEAELFHNIYTTAEHGSTSSLTPEEKDAVIVRLQPQ